MAYSFKVDKNIVTAKPKRHIQCENHVHLSFRIHMPININSLTHSATHTMWHLHIQIDGHLGWTFEIFIHEYTIQMAKPFDISLLVYDMENIFTFNGYILPSIYNSSNDDTVESDWDGKDVA